MIKSKIGAFIPLHKNRQKKTLLSLQLRSEFKIIIKNILHTYIFYSLKNQVSDDIIIDSVDDEVQTNTSILNNYSNPEHISSVLTDAEKQNTSSPLVSINPSM